MFQYHLVYSQIKWSLLYSVRWIHIESFIMNLCHSTSENGPSVTDNLREVGSCNIFIPPPPPKKNKLEKD